MKYLKLTPIIVLLAVMMVSCEDKKKGELNGESYLEEYEKTPTWEELLADSIVEKEHVGKECGVVCNNLDIATDRLTHVLSPDGLISAKKMYIVATANLSNDTKGMTAHELSMVKNHKADADKAYGEACRKYEVPASGVIANLNDMIKGIDKVKNTQDMYRFEDCRLGVLRNLENVYLCVEQKDSKGISEVKRLSLVLKSKYDAKRHEVGMK